MSGSLKRFSILLVLLAAIWAGIFYARSSGRPNRLTILSVGQGSCAVFQNDGRTVLIDAGPATDQMDAGERLVVPGLRKLGVGAIDLVLISHLDNDHIGGLRAVLERYTVGRIVLPSSFKGHPQLRGLPVDKLVWLDRSAIIRLGDAVLQLESPFLAQPAKDNDASMFVRITDGNAVAVFSGDAPIEVEMMMIDRLPNWKAQVQVAGHHGSRTATGAGWLGAVQPSFLAISCGRNNAYGHPHKSVLEAAAGASVKVLRTDRDGDLVFDVSPSGFVPSR